VRECALCAEVKYTDKAKEVQCITIPENIELCQMIIKPPDAPTEGTYTNSSKLEGQHCLIKPDQNAFSWFLADIQLSTH
jgi:hypothetical protein